jgi:hypothetical protein
VIYLAVFTKGFRKARPEVQFTEDVELDRRPVRDADPDLAPEAP